MATVRKSITFTDKLNDWMQALITEGEYANESEYVRDLVRRDRERNAKFKALKAAIQEGIDSGVSDKSVSGIMKEVEDKLRENGQI